MFESVEIFFLCDAHAKQIPASFGIDLDKSSACPVSCRSDLRPNLFSDVSYFDNTYSLPGSSMVKILLNNPTTCPTGSVACVETAMDTEWAHVMAPGLFNITVEDLR